MEAKFSNRVKEVISLSREEALRLGHDYIGTEHLLLGMVREGEGVAVAVLKKLGVPLDELRGEIEKISKGTATHEIKNLANIPKRARSEVQSGQSRLSGFYSFKILSLKCENQRTAHCTLANSIK